MQCWGQWGAAATTKTYRNIRTTVIIRAVNRSWAGVYGGQWVGCRDGRAVNSSIAHQCSWWVRNWTATLRMFINFANLLKLSDRTQSITEDNRICQTNPYLSSTQVFNESSMLGSFVSSYRHLNELQYQNPTLGSPLHAFINYDEAFRRWMSYHPHQRLYFLRWNIVCLMFKHKHLLLV